MYECPVCGEQDCEEHEEEVRDHGMERMPEKAHSTHTVTTFFLAGDTSN